MKMRVEVLLVVVCLFLGGGLGKNMFTKPLSGVNKAQSPIHLDSTKMQLPIIQINSTHFIKGRCSSDIVNNECKGEFIGRKVVTCSGTPLTLFSDFHSCTPLPNESFGYCTGITSSRGCEGRYRQLIRTANGEILTLRTLNKVHYDLQRVKGMSRVKVTERGENTTLKHNIFCYREFNPKTLTCDRGIYRIVDLMPSGVTPGLYRIDAYVCDHSTIQLGGKVTCLGQEYKKYSCLGKSHFVHRGGSINQYTCLGSMKTLVCKNGGEGDTCKDEEGTRTQCLSSFYDGQLCLKDKPAENTDLVIADLGREKLTDVDGRDVTVHMFKVKKFTMYGAYSVQSSLKDSILDKLYFNQGTRNPKDGSFTDLDMPETPSPLKIDEGRLKVMDFRNLQFDELPYYKFCNDDQAKIIKVTFEEMVIKQLFLEKMHLENIAVQNLTVKDDSFSYYGIDNERIKLAYGEMILRDVTIYLPYISNKEMSAWKASEASVVDAKLSVPKVEGISIPNYMIKVDKSNTLFLEFPHLSIEDRSIDLLTLEDFILSNQQFTTTPEAASTLQSSYLEWLSSHP